MPSRSWPPRCTAAPRVSSRARTSAQHRKSIRTAWSAVAALVLLLVAVGIAVLVAVKTAATAREQRDVATSRQLALQATVRLDSDPQLATLLGLAATQIADRYEAQSAQLQLLERDKQVLRFLGGHTNVVEAAAFSPDGKMLATGGPDGRALLWDVARRVRIGELAGQVVTAVAFTPDGATLAAADVDGVALWDVTSRTRLATLPSSAPYSLGVSADGTRIASGLTDGTVAVWDMATGRRIATLTGHTWRVTSVALSPDGQTVAAGGGEGTVLVWDSRTGAQTATIPGYPIQLKGRVAFSPDGTLLALSGRSGAVQLWKVADGSLQTLKGNLKTVQSLAFLDSTTLVSGSFDGALVVWDLPSEKIRQSAISPISPVTTIAVGPDRRTVVSGGFDGTAVLWDLSRSFAEQVGAPTMVLAATGDPTGRLIATAEFSGAVAVRDPARRRPGADPSGPGPGELRHQPDRAGPVGRAQLAGHHEPGVQPKRPTGGPGRLGQQDCSVGPRPASAARRSAGRPALLQLPAWHSARTVSPSPPQAAPGPCADPLGCRPPGPACCPDRQRAPPRRCGVRRPGAPLVRRRSGPWAAVLRPRSRLLAPSTVRPCRPRAQ